MTVYQNNPNISILAAVAVAANLLVRADGTLCGADANRDQAGTSRDDYAAGQDMTVRMLGAGSHKMVAAGVVAPGDRVTKAAGGQVEANGANAHVGVAVTAAAAAGDVIEVLPN